jgi:hypothetical protein
MTKSICELEICDLRLKGRSQQLLFNRQSTNRNRQIPSVQPDAIPGGQEAETPVGLG